MTTTRRSFASAALHSRWLTAAALFSFALAAIFGQTVGRAAPGGSAPPPVSLCGDDPSLYAPCDKDHVHGLLVTGNYVVGGVDFPSQSGGGGSLTQTINMNVPSVSTVPHLADGSPAEIVSAHLHWETITSDDSQLSGVSFRGFPVAI